MWTHTYVRACFTMSERIAVKNVAEISQQMVQMVTSANECKLLKYFALHKR